MILKVKILKEAGYEEALFGLSLNKNVYKEKLWKDRIEQVAKKLAFHDGGHNKFLEHIYVWLDVVAPRYWWQEADTYRLSSKQSQSTMHTILKGFLTNDDFEEPISEEYLKFLNNLISDKNLIKIKAYLPEGFIQKREWVMSYKTLKGIISQRKNHLLPHWKFFVDEILKNIEHPELLEK